mmetsp:Transcript_73752/g.196006  ORF Transcript_73752/g.196006 Transcript_73752/m.196006 type:complete len:272 (-) Transcript_73752:741-1556(-)
MHSSGKLCAYGSHRLLKEVLGGLGLSLEKLCQALILHVGAGILRERNLDGLALAVHLLRTGLVGVLGGCQALSELVLGLEGRQQLADVREERLVAGEVPLLPCLVHGVRQAALRLRLRHVLLDGLRVRCNRFLRGRLRGLRHLLALLGPLRQARRGARATALLGHGGRPDAGAPRIGDGVDEHILLADGFHVLAELLRAVRVAVALQLGGHVQGFLGALELLVGLVCQDLGAGALRLAELRQERVHAVGAGGGAALVAKHTGLQLVRGVVD